MQSALLIAKRPNEAQMTARLRFLDRDDAVVGNPVKCRVTETNVRPSEDERGARETSQATVEIAVPLGTTVDASLRCVVAFPDGAEAEYQITNPPVPVSNASQLTFQAIKVG